MKRKKNNLIQLLNKSDIKHCPYYSDRPNPVFSEEGMFMSHRQEIEKSSEEFKALLLYFPQDKRGKEHLLFHQGVIFDRAFNDVDEGKYKGKITQACFVEKTTTPFGKIHPNLKAIIQGEK
jgi:hypothetical protein